jgi:hypothetical protein
MEMLLLDAAARGQRWAEKTLETLEFGLKFM